MKSNGAAGLPIQDFLSVLIVTCGLTQLYYDTRLQNLNDFDCDLSTRSLGVDLTVELNSAYMTHFGV